MIIWLINAYISWLWLTSVGHFLFQQKRNTDNKSVESNRNDYKRREMSNTHSENSKDLYVNEELYEAVWEGKSVETHLWSLSV